MKTAKLSVYFIFKVCSLLIAVYSLLACDDQKPQQHQMPPPAVSIINITEQPVGSHKEYVARAEASKTVDLKARVEGFLIKRNFIEGQMVEKNQLLFQIDKKPFQASLKKAEADLASAKAELNTARKSLIRNKDLFRKGHLSQASLDKAVSAEAQALASVEVAEAGVETARLNLEYTEIHAPFKGEVGLAKYSVGNLVNSGSDSLAQLTSIDPVYVNFQVNEKTVINHLQSDAGKNDLTEDNKRYDIRLRLPNDKMYSKLGKLNFANTKIDETTGTLTLRAAFPNPDGVVVPGLYVTLIVDSREKVPHVVIPQAAVQENQSGYFVLVVSSDNKVQSRLTKMGRRIGPMWVVDSGLKPGEQLIVEGLQKVRNGVTVSPTRVSVNAETGAIEVTASKSAQQGH
ncbi:efflux transporter periplasmic adaptor subunit [Endozoicomonas sp. OPT23]|uniref:efflux RND transporter periplasmic adaptor subunit n=1 Tax=Endozoicomonas sp. OPT23 TaxID=2072845 RepID=UPI00129A41BE|nr:efflux RND transporter periplasmic adaptor subunit [Endozoicomonas sp. OPT23]MRI32043.1 efflux transporter periplasmic adaptor subunit [Endozoicomonas sp. OPT23]